MNPAGRIAAYLDLWRRRLVSVAQQTTILARGVATLVHALRLAPRTSPPAGGPMLVLVDAATDAAFLRFLLKLRLVPPLEVSAVSNLDALEARLGALAASGWNGRLVVAGPLYARFHTSFGARNAAGRYVVI